MKEQKRELGEVWKERSKWMVQGAKARIGFKTKETALAVAASIKQVATRLDNKNQLVLD